ncbi:homeobox protein cut-like isoform X2 [Amphibalanus amphitrite]|uniref:homeobox protein cut-like isoform X2 n=1 Tax=Amphibalanus amphitrite TaxID=1232801 RepID=UPI001C90DB74|nr:homeobox protein cut-like isoform X2 [Amphibalanus amphitrite]
MDVQTMSSVDPVFKKEEVPMIIAQFWQQRAALAEREARTLKEQLAASRERTPSRHSEAASSGAGHPDSASETQRRASLGGSDVSKEKESSDLVEDVRRLQSRLAQVENHTAQQRAKLLEELETKKKTIQRLQNIIEQQKDYNDIKKGIVLLKSMKGGGGPERMDTGPPSPPADKSLDVLKELQNERTEPRGVSAVAPTLGDPRPPLVEPSLLGFRGSAPGCRPPFLPTPHFPFAPFPPSATGALVSLASRSPSSPGERRGSLSPPERARGTPESESTRQPSPAETPDAPPTFRYDENDPLIPKSDPMETRLQEMLRYNMDKYANQSLDTLQLSRRVRELLSVNNIGQRMFARYILGLSQGTVSELLSKPKTWEKLTEKGRDSYRKMHAWAVDDAAVSLLKAVIPKRGKDARASFPARPEESATDERIAHILTEASQAMKNESVASTPSGDAGAGERTSPGAADRTRQSPQADSRDPFQPLRRLGGGGMPGAGPEEVAQEKIARLYRDHLAKMMGQRPELPPGFPLDHYQRLRSPEELRLAMDLYNQQLMSQLHRQHVGNGGPPPESRRDEADRDGGRSPAFTHVRREEDGSTGGGPPSPLPLPPGLLSGLHPGGLFMHSAAAAAAAAAASSADEPVTSASPLQRMASITNSLMSSAAMPPMPPHPTRPAKAVLPPITQQQFDQYSNINTEQVVKRIKEHLSQYSLSQRLFGESVLGLSQGSVSDLLARPKPWHMLTQKGREPFIRMQMFLEDEGAVHKLVASQYKIAPDKLMRTGCFNGGFAKLPPKAPELARTLEAPLPPVVSLPSFHGLPPAALASRLAGLDPLMKYGLRLPPVPLPMSVYETAAVTPELDTLTITTRIKEVLLANNIGQKLFGEVVLGLSQGSVSELLSKPKPWHLLSIKGREPFIRMKMWLEDGQNIQKLQRIKSERKESNKRRRSRLELPVDGDSSDAYSSLANSPNSAKKARVLFSEEQKEALLLAFAMDPYPNMTSVEFLCQELGLTQRTITNWFHNHRMRLKQQTGGGESAVPPPPPAGREGGHLEPLQFRLLLGRRLAELRAERGLPPQLPLAGLPLPYLVGGAGAGSTDGLDEQVGGLDLTMKSDDGDGDRSSSAGSGSEASRSAASSPAPVGTDAADGDGDPEPAPRSRRKPAAPQWLNPQWGAEEPRPLINGVCVLQTDLATARRGADSPQPSPERPADAAEPELSEQPEPEPERQPEPEQEPMEQEPMEQEPAAAEPRRDSPAAAAAE